MNYCAGYIRQQENQQLGLPREKVQTFEPRLRELVGYGVYNMLIGHINKQSPEQLLLGDGTTQDRLGRDSEPWQCWKSSTTRACACSRSTAPRR